MASQPLVAGSITDFEKMVSDDIKALENEEKYYQQKLAGIQEELKELRKNYRKIKRRNKTVQEETA